MAIVILFALSAAVAYWASCRGRSWVLWGLLSLFLSPLLTAIILAILKDKSVERDLTELRMGQQQMHDRMSMDERTTQQQFQQMQSALASQQQGMQQLAASQQSPAQTPQALPQRSHFCANCGAPLEAGASFCASCGAKVED